tara:strand:- start:2222 stop:2404 length:183 start_codon:yes stop_codon:yes gene_type:complete
VPLVVPLVLAVVVLLLAVVPLVPPLVVLAVVPLLPVAGQLKHSLTQVVMLVVEAYFIEEI